MPEEPRNEAVVKITMTHLYQKLIDIETRLGDHPKQLDDHEKRIRNLEMKVWSAASLGSALAIIISAIITKLP